MNILLIGSGGREHALAWKLAQSPHTEKLFCAPGNPGMKNCIPVLADTPEDLANFAELNKIDLTMVGPEALLLPGNCRLLYRPWPAHCRARDQRRRPAGGSKSFAKDFMFRHGLPTAKAKS